MSEIQVNSAAQATSFWIAAALGAALCLLYDLLRLVRLIRRPSTAAAFVQDVLWWSAAAISTYIVMLVLSRGAVRAYILAGEALGLVACRLTLSRFLMRLFRPLARGINSAGRFIRRRILAPAAELLSKSLAALVPKVKKFRVFLKNLLKRLIYLVYNPHKCRKKSSAQKGDGK